MLTFVRSDTLRLIRNKRVLTNDATLHNICLKNAGIKVSVNKMEGIWESIPQNSIVYSKPSISERVHEPQGSSCHNTQPDASYTQSVILMEIKTF